MKFVDSGRYYEVDVDGNVKEFDFIIDENPANIKIGLNEERLLGTEESPFEIWCIEDLVEWSQNYSEYKNSYIKLCRKLNFNSNLSYTDGKVLECDTIEQLKNLLTNTEETGFTPIKNFSGTFNGQGYEIKNIYINSTEHAGLFEYVSNATIKNLKISGEIISQKSAGGFAATARWK